MFPYVSHTWGTVNSRYKFNSKLQTTFGGTVETIGAETKTGFCITKTPYEDFFWHSRALNREASSPIQLKFELHWDFMPVLVASLKKIWLQMNIFFFFTTQGHLTPKWLIRSGCKSNLSEILSLLPVSLMKIEFIVLEKKWRHHFLHYKSMGKNFNNSNVNNPIQPKFELIRAFMPLLVTCKFDKDPIKGDWEKLETSLFSLFSMHVTPKWLVRYNRNSNSSEILCLSSLPVSLIKTEFIVTEKGCRHHFPHSKSMGTLKDE